MGDGPYRQQLEKIFDNTATTFVGYLCGEDLSSAYSSGDAFLFPSSTETLGLVLLEAMDLEGKQDHQLTKDPQGFSLNQFRATIHLLQSKWLIGS